MNESKIEPKVCSELDASRDWLRGFVVLSWMRGTNESRQVERSFGATGRKDRKVMGREFLRRAGHSSKVGRSNNALYAKLHG